MESKDTVEECTLNTIFYQNPVSVLWDKICSSDGHYLSMYISKGWAIIHLALAL
jgi:hypothetical protein